MIETALGGSKWAERGGAQDVDGELGLGEEIVPFDKGKAGSSAHRVATKWFIQVRMVCSALLARRSCGGMFGW